jgi:hypothetical protein
MLGIGVALDPLLVRADALCGAVAATSPLAMSIMSLASWAGSRGRLGRFSGMVRVCREGGRDARGRGASP